MPRRCTAPIARSSDPYLGIGAEHFLGVTVQPMIKLDGYELIIGCNPDPQFSPVLLFGHRRATGGTDQGSRACLTATEHDTGDADDGTHRDLPDPEGGPWLPSRRSRQTGAADGPVQRAGARASADQGDRHQPAFRLAQEADRAGRPGGPARGGGGCGPAAPLRHPSLSHTVRRPVDGQGRPDRHDPPDPARRRAAGGPVPREAVRGHRLLRPARP